MDTGHDDVLRDFISEMKRLRSMLDQRTKAYSDTYEDLAAFMKTIRGRKILSPQLERQFQAKLRKVRLTMSWSSSPAPARVCTGIRAARKAFSIAVSCALVRTSTAWSAHRPPG